MTEKICVDMRRNEEIKVLRVIHIGTLFQKLEKMRVRTMRAKKRGGGKRGGEEIHI